VGSAKAERGGANGDLVVFHGENTGRWTGKGGRNTEIFPLSLLIEMTLPSFQLAKLMCFSVVVHIA
jgi:hypothetical protein